MASEKILTSVTAEGRTSETVSEDTDIGVEIVTRSSAPFSALLAALITKPGRTRLLQMFFRDFLRFSTIVFQIIGLI